MKTVTLQVVEGVDKGRVYRELEVPVTIGREEGNLLRLNDERVSRFHAKIQFDNEDVILTDLDSTNGTRINGNPIQIRRLKAGDRVGVGRTIMIFGTHAEIAMRMAAEKSASQATIAPNSRTVNAVNAAASLVDDDETDADGSRAWSAADHALPELPQSLSPSQAARLSEVLDYLHRGLTSALANLKHAEDRTEIVVPLNDWQKVQMVQLLLARYLRSVAEPETLAE
jgi:pSer/pThr/pTyr-binding forkhead associated (FHA) protein